MVLFGHRNYMHLIDLSPGIHMEGLAWYMYAQCGNVNVQGQIVHEHVVT